jgi:hypothetical protein
MKIIELITWMHQKNSILSVTGWLNVGLFLLAFVAYFFDSRTILGINPWIKPMKFTISLIFYVWTMIFILHYLTEGNPQKVSWYSYLIGISMLIEIFLIFVQSYRGTTSHFNIQNILNTLIFNIMGVFILLNTIVLILISIDFFGLKSAHISPEMHRAIFFGLILMLLASFEAGFMLGINRHTVGAADGSSGLPFLNWSTKFGDLRIAHFVGMHAIQVLPLLVLLNQKWALFSTSSAKLGLVNGGALLILLLMVSVLIQALAGLPLIRINS